MVLGKGGRLGAVERGRPAVSTAAGVLERGCGAVGSTRQWADWPKQEVVVSGR